MSFDREKQNKLKAGTSLVGAGILGGVAAKKFMNAKPKEGTGSTSLIKKIFQEYSMKINVETAIAVGLGAVHLRLLEQVDTKSKDQIVKSHTAQEVMKAAASQGVDPKDALKKAKKMGAFRKVEESVWNQDERMKYFEDWVKENYKTEVIDGTPK